MNTKIALINHTAQGQTLKQCHYESKDIHIIFGFTLIVVFVTLNEKIMGGGDCIGFMVPPK